MSQYISDGTMGAAMGFSILDHLNAANEEVERARSQVGKRPRTAQRRYRKNYRGNAGVVSMGESAASRKRQQDEVNAFRASLIPEWLIEFDYLTGLASSGVIHSDLPGDYIWAKSSHVEIDILVKELAESSLRAGGIEPFYQGPPSGFPAAAIAMGQRPRGTPVAMWVGVGLVAVGLVVVVAKKAKK